MMLNVFLIYKKALLAIYRYVKFSNKRKGKETKHTYESDMCTSNKRPLSLSSDLIMDDGGMLGLTKVVLFIT